MCLQGILNKSVRWEVVVKGKKGSEIDVKIKKFKGNSQVRLKRAFLAKKKPRKAVRKIVSCTFYYHPFLMVTRSRFDRVTYGHLSFSSKSF